MSPDEEHIPHSSQGQVGSRTGELQPCCLVNFTALGAGNFRSIVAIDQVPGPAGDN